VAAFALIEAGFYAAGALRLVYPPQDLELLHSSVDVVNLLFSYALWGPRYCLGYPAVLIRNQFNLSLNHSYALLCVLVMSLVVVLSAHTAEAYYDLKHRRFLLYTSAVVFWSILLCFMNGRLVNCFFGMLLVLLSQGRAARRGRLNLADMLLQAAGVYCSMMSSGTMWVVLAQCGIGDLALVVWRRAWRWLLWLAALVAGFAPFFLAAQEKNLSFFGGRVTAMLNHGWGAVFHLDDVMTLLMMLAVVTVVGWLVGLAWHRWRQRIPDSLLWFNLPLGLLGGAFGYSTGTMVIPAMLLLATAGVLGLSARSSLRLAAPPAWWAHARTTAGD
jgi:hypothetical protein